MCYRRLQKLRRSETSLPKSAINGKHRSMRRHHAGFVLGALCCASSLLFAATEHTRGPLTASRPCLVRFAIPFFPPCCSLVPSLFSLYMFGGVPCLLCLLSAISSRVLSGGCLSSHINIFDINSDLLRHRQGHGRGLRAAGTPSGDVCYLGFSTARDLNALILLKVNDS